MSDLQQSASILDGLILGEPISNHHGVRCCPAIEESSDDKYIIKIISLPESQSKLDALIFTGACADTDQALAYFKELAQGVLSEAELLTRLSQLEGFVNHVQHEIREMHNGIGYQVFLQSRYMPSLTKLMHDQPLTHLDAVNLGLDLCAALTASRRLGYLYVDLRPENVFFCENQGYRIGDLGFIPLTSLKYSSLPERYRSVYTAPEVADALSSLSDTMDIYALGLVLYQIFNNGQLPFEQSPPTKPLPTPLYADYEMADIILKACAPDSKDRWQDPAQMGQALVDYLQRNRVNATPIIPAPVVFAEPDEEISSFLTEEENNAELEELLAALPEELPPVQLSMDGSMLPLEVDTPTSLQEDPNEAQAETDENQLSFLADQADNDSEPADEFAQMLALADDLIAHQLPEPVVAPGPIDVAIPVEIGETEAELASDEPDIPVPVIAQEDDDEPAESVDYDTEDDYLYDLPVRRSRRWVAAVIVAVFLLAAAIGGYVWYNQFFLQRVDSIDLQGSGTQLRVSVVSNIDEKLLSAICTDSYGNTLRAPVIGGVASFEELTPGTLYRIRLEISGLHKLTGSTTGIYTTEAQTTIQSFTAICGPEDGSVILAFSPNGPEPSLWTVTIYGSGEANRTETFTGHALTLYNLTPGKEYTFHLKADTTLPLAGQTHLQYTAQKILCAQNIQIPHCGDGSLTVQWDQPEGSENLVWLLRCYNDAGYDETVSTTELSYTFTGLDHSTGYTILITAEGMPQSVSTSITANPINLTGYRTEIVAPYALQLSWDFTGKAPENGWILTYRINDDQEILLPCATNQVVLALIPGAVYEYDVRPSDDITFFGQNGSFTADCAEPFDIFGITAENLTAQLVLRPESESWNHTDLSDESYKTEFTAEEKIAVLLSVNTNFTLSDDPVTVIFAIRDDAAQLISAEQLNTTWQALWVGARCPLNLPFSTEVPGNYTLDLYMNDQMIYTFSFTIMS